MNVLLVGSGGREHALAWKLGQSKKLSNLYIAPGNPGTAEIGTNVDIDATDIQELLKFALTNSIDLTIVGPDQPLALGIVDKFKKNGLKIFGPSKAAAKIESSKKFAKQMMVAAGVPTASFKTFNDVSKAEKYLAKQDYPLFIKASGLAEGKGAIYAANYSEAEQIVKDMMVNKDFGDAGSTVVIESFLEGPEVSLHALSDGKNYLLFPLSQDHKPVNDGDKGPNTGGMGSVAPLPWIEPSATEVLGNRVVKQLLKQLLKKATPFVGLLYPGLKLTPSGPKVVEYNARFGDPETQVYMRLLKSDLLDLLISCVDGKLKSAETIWQKNKYAVNIALASVGYPGAYEVGVPIRGLEKAALVKDVVIFQAGTAYKNGKLVTNGGRVLYVSALGNTIKQAQDRAYQAVRLVKFKGMHYRTDIGNKAIEMSGALPKIFNKSS